MFLYSWSSGGPVVRSLLQKSAPGLDEVPQQDGGSTDQVQWNSVTISHR